MTCATNDSRSRRFRHYLLAGAAGLLFFLLAAALLATSWNLFALQMFGAEPMSMRGATGLLLFLLIVSAAIRMPRRGARHASR